VPLDRARGRAEQPEHRGVETKALLDGELRQGGILPDAVEQARLLGQTEQCVGEQRGRRLVPADQQLSHDVDDLVGTEPVPLLLGDHQCGHEVVGQG
jgi:hypothetical protein